MDRRSFLKIHNAAADEAWSLFCNRLRRFVHGAWESLAESSDGYPQARLQLERTLDFDHVRALAEQYDIALVLDGTLPFDALIGRPGLWLKLPQTMEAPDFFSEEACLAPATTLVGTLLEQGYEQFRGVPPLLNLAQWFADPHYHDMRPGLSFLSGVERIQVVFANGDKAVVGGFGVNDTAPLNIAILHKAIPRLFEMLQQTQIREALEAPIWPYAYRFDALHNKHVDPNIARVFLGHRGSLLWVQSLVIRKIPPLQRLLRTAAEWQQGYAEGLCGGEADLEIKQLFDPTGMYPYFDELFKTF